MKSDFITAKKDVILVVDDQPNNLKVIGSVLGEEYIISIANNGINALKSLDNFLPDLILLDIMMPEMDGYEVCRRIKQNPATKDIPIIFLTAKSDINDIVKGFESGGVDYITKPFNPLEVKVRVKNHLKLYHSEKALVNRDQILHSLINASERFLNTSNWEKNIDIVLKQFTAALNITNTRIFEYEDTEEFKSLLKLKHASGCAHDQENDDHLLVCFIIDKKDWLKQLKENKPVWGTTSAAEENDDQRYQQLAGSVLAIPVFADEYFWGFIEFFDQNEKRVWQNQEIETLALIGNIIGAAIKRTKVERKLQNVYDALMNELELASSVQQFLLPNWVKIDDNMIFSSTYKPHNKIGGDFYDYQKISDSQYVSYVGDVSGHGVQASLIMTAVKSIINMLISSEKDGFCLWMIVNRLNSIISKGLLDGNYLTFIICLIDLDKKEIRYLNAGHPPVIGYNVKSLKSSVFSGNSDIPVGWFPDFEYSHSDESIIPMQDDMVYLIYTDGLFECENTDGEQLGLDRISGFIDDTASDCYCFKLPHVIRQKLIDNQYNIDLDDFTIVSFATKQSQLITAGKFFFVIRATYANSSKLAQECAKRVLAAANDQHLADKTEIVVNVFLNNIIQLTQNNKLFDLITLELSIKKDVELKFINRGGDLQYPISLQARDFDLLNNTRDLGLLIVTSLVSNISYAAYSEIFETTINIDNK